jgi:DNA-binding LacI/PurR family transcriptional regulator
MSIASFHFSYEWNIHSTGDIGRQAMAKRASAQDVADLAGVSKWTVIRAFTPGASITETTRSKVMATAEKLNYRPNLLARSLATNLTHQVAVLVDDFDNPSKLGYLAKLTRALQANGLLALLVNINDHNDHVDALINAEQRQVDAVILFGTGFRNEMLADRRLKGAAPIFVLARGSQIEGVPAINCDTDRAMTEICDYLHAKGYRKPAFLAGPRVLSTALGRRRRFRELWLERGIELVSGMVADAYSDVSGAAAVRAFFSAPEGVPDIDVLMCENDALAFGAISVLRDEFGFKVPENIAIVGFDNTALAASPAFELTTYEQPMEEMVIAAVDMILGRRPVETVSFPGSLVARRSA